MTDIMNIIRDFKTGCPCGKEHETTVRDVRIGSGIVSQVGAILKENGFTVKDKASSEGWNVIVLK